MKLIPAAETFYKRQDYGAKPPIEGVAVHQLKRFRDDGGSMTELSRFTSGRPDAMSDFDLAQLNYSVMEPGVLKAFHVHRRQADVWFVPPEDRVLLVLVDVREGSPTERNVLKILLGDGASMLVRIPPGVAHGCKNLGSGPARIVYMTDARFSPDPAQTDEGRLPWDMVGAEIWEPAKD
ncbi:MAG TPA: dTDP-4-dehydrorhamnose 3,5-epimerase family protein [Candidatus Polarisedimenticolaceae bacterium]|nr:dTDP-4-dehydrorhamnose 3,5-epimerase family protein [Candidatus Polarisedimenticolaceae bacterium]